MDATQVSFAIGTIVGSLVSGAIVGLVPLLMGLKKGLKGLAIGGFVACIVGSFFLGLLLSVPICVVFAILISVQAKKANDQAAAQNNNNINNTVA